MEPLRLSSIGVRGVDVVNKPQDLDQAELSQAQNAEMKPGGKGALDQRPGMTAINASPLSGPIGLAMDVAPTLLVDKTARLYAGMYSGSTHNWRYSTDGTTWVNDDTPSKPFSSGSIGFFRNFPKVVTVGQYLYYCDAASPIQLHRYDGTTDLVVATIPAPVSNASLGLPVLTSVTYGGSGLRAPFLTVQGITGSSGLTGPATFGYAAVTNYRDGGYSAATTGITTNCPLTLNSTGYIPLLVTGPNTGLSGAITVDIYRTAGGMALGKIGTIPATGGVTIFDTGLSVTPGGNPSSTGSIDLSTTYTYKVVARAGASYSAASTGVSVTTGPTGLSTGNFIAVLPSGPVASAQSYDVYRTVGGTTQGKIGVIGITSGGAFTTGNGGAVAGTTFADTNLVGDGTTPPTVAAGASTGAVVGILDMVTDGTQVYLAVDDGGTDPQISGRVLQYAPGANSWITLGTPYPQPNGNGTPGAIAFVDGALTFGTYIGTTSGNPSYLTTTNIPVYGGGINEVHATANSLAACAMVPFKGNIYVGCVSLVAATAAVVLKRAPVQTWSTARTGPATAQYNAYTALAVFNSTLFAGWTSGGGLTAARIESSTDGTTWALDLTLDAAEVVCQMVVFNNKLYALLGKTNVAYNTKSRIVQRDTSGVWTEVDNPADDFAGCLGVLYA